jgi:hypothetical protein
MCKQDPLKFPTNSRFGSRGRMVKQRNLLDRKVSIAAPIGSGETTRGEGSRRITVN